jgi:twinkle protein
MVANWGASYIVLDHISIIVSSQENGDERKALDEIMTRLRKLCEELGICIVLVSHLKRPSGQDGHENGGVTSLSQLRGSAGIGQLADVVLGIERNGQHEDARKRNLSTIRVLKSRKTGLTGPACKLYWDNDKYSFTEVPLDGEDEFFTDLERAATEKLETPAEI